ncbi:MAG: Uma2 family endonuclease [Myxococcaceae bacterium]
MHQLKESRATVEDLMAMPEDTKAELIDGVIYAMAPVAANHSFTSTKLVSKVSLSIDNKKKKGPSDMDSWVILAEAWTDYGVYNSFVHDIAAFSKKDLPALPERGPIMAKPVWVCEIISPSNWINDTQRKRVVLEKHRVPYYWLVDPIRKNIQVFELKDGVEHYQIIQAVENADGVMKLPPFGDLEIDLMQIFDY